MGNVDWQDPVLGNWGFGAFTILLIADLGSNQPTQTSSARCSQWQIPRAAVRSIDNGRSAN